MDSRLGISDSDFADKKPRIVGDQRRDVQLEEKYCIPDLIRLHPAWYMKTRLVPTIRNSSSHAPTPSPMDAAEPSPPITSTSKILNACDECRTRKLKCSGEPTGCARCITDSISCHYSPRKQMGRPRKRRRENGTLNENQDQEGLDYDHVDDIKLYDSTDDNQYFRNNVSYSTLEGNGSMPVLDPDLPALDIYDAQVYNQDYGQDGQDSHGGQYNFDFSQGLGTNPLVSFPELMPHDPVQNFASHGRPIQQQTPTTTLDDYPRSALSAGSGGGCGCLPRLYAVLGTFHATPTPSFPYSMGGLREGARLATETVRCQNCVKEYNTALQNSMLLGTLMNLIIHEYKKLLEHIDERSTSSEAISLRMGENSPGMEHLHTGSLNCPMGINVELSGDEFKNFARKTVRKEVLGPGDNNLAQILQEMKDRQKRLHSNYNGELHRQTTTEEAANNHEHGKNSCVCIQAIFIERLRNTLDVLNL